MGDRADRDRGERAVHAWLVVIVLASVACARTRVVEAPMTDARASSALARKHAGALAPPDDAADVPFRSGDRWTGTYTCRQGPTEMKIVVEEIARSSGGDGTIDVSATLEFSFAGSASFPAADGLARMRGEYDPRSKRLRLVGEEWLDQPSSYALVTFSGSVSSGAGRGERPLTYVGTVEGPGCSSFSVRSEPRRAPLPPSPVLPP